MLLNGKTALITGAGRGIGRGIALAFAREGCRTAVTARTESELEETARLIQEAGGESLSVVCDVAAEESVQAATKRVLDAWGRIDILVNNAGYARFAPFLETDFAEWQRTLEVNMNGVWLCTKAVATHMAARGEGRVINVASVAGHKPIAKQSAYCASKHGMLGLSKTLALELRDHGIFVHAISPGGVDTRLTREAMPERDKSNWMTPEDIAQAALFLASLSPRATVDDIVIRRFGSVPLGG